MNIKTLSLLFFAVTVLGVLSNAQNINTISYVPVKTGSYDKITTKSVTALAHDIGNVSAKTLKVNSSKLTVETRKLTFGKPVVVKGSVYAQNQAVFAVKNRLAVNGVVQASGTVAANKSLGATAVQATNLNMPTRKLDVGSNSIYVDGIEIPNPGCNLEWRSVNAKNAFNQDVTYNLLACNGGVGCQCSGGIFPGGTQPCGGNANCLKTCQSDCQWGTCVGTNGYTWTGTDCINCAPPKTLVSGVCKCVKGQNGASCGSNSDCSNGGTCNLTTCACTGGDYKTYIGKIYQVYTGGTPFVYGVQDEIDPTPTAAFCESADEGGVESTTYYDDMCGVLTCSSSYGVCYHKSGNSHNFELHKVGRCTSTVISEPADCSAAFCSSNPGAKCKDGTPTVAYGKKAYSSYVICKPSKVPLCNPNLNYATCSNNCSAKSYWYTKSIYSRNYYKCL